MAYNIERNYKFNTTQLELSRDLPTLIDLLETLLTKYELDNREGFLPSLDFLNHALNDMNDHVGELMEEYERMLIQKEEMGSHFADRRYYEDHYGTTN